LLKDQKGKVIKSNREKNLIDDLAVRVGYLKDLNN